MSIIETPRRKGPRKNKMNNGMTMTMKKERKLRRARKVGRLSYASVPPLGHDKSGTASRRPWIGVQEAQRQPPGTDSVKNNLGIPYEVINSLRKDGDMSPGVPEVIDTFRNSNNWEEGEGEPSVTTEAAQPATTLESKMRPLT